MGRAPTQDRERGPARARAGARHRARAPSGPDRLTAAARREALIDVAFELLRRGGPASVSIHTVAERSGVTRTLVYKHFANREDLRSAVFRREAARLDAQMVAEVSAEHGLEARLRTFVRAVLRAVDTHGSIFLPLQAQASERGYREEQRARDRRTVRAFAELASGELGIPMSDATAAVSILLSGMASLRTQARTRGTAAERKRLEDLYVTLVLAALSALRPGRRCP
jgi:AcrR family transcriptional regulator